jgi:hydrogenase maturation protein HypF
VKTEFSYSGTKADWRPHERLFIKVSGKVQGVGFRPFIYRLAHELCLRGWVRNSVRGVEIDVEGEEHGIKRLLHVLKHDLPPLASVESIVTENMPLIGYCDFSVRESDPHGAKTATLLPDSATCPDCLAEILDPHNRRYRYPFTNCTNCGPRFSIIEALPYDRANTTMRGFTMCPECQREYDDPANRRFHAQPNACPNCGPNLELWDRNGKMIVECDDALLQAAELIRRGEVVALKGLGGFQLLVDAHNGDAVAELRRRKVREEKPFALMYPSIARIRKDCNIGDKEESLLLSTRAPILLVRRTDNCTSVATVVAPGNPYLGVMLPYTPLHHLLMTELRFPIVATSGNISDEPICIDENEALVRLKGIADFFLVHNRPIARQVDDSVVQAVAGQEMVLRSARGYAPLSLPHRRECSHTLAVGGHMKNSVAVRSGNTIVTSQHIGDLSTAEACRAMERAVDTLTNVYEVKHTSAVIDMHPDYQSTRFASSRHLPVTTVQHHFAHVAGCMIEHDLGPPLLGISWDGTGHGTDGTVWGGEFLHITDDGFERAAHLRCFRLPGGHAAVREPRRSAIGLLYEISRDGTFALDHLPPLRALTDSQRRNYERMLSKRINSPLTSSAGRLFDAIAALLDVAQVSTFEGQAAMKLQFVAESVRTSDLYDFNLQSTESPWILDWEPMVRQILDDIERCVSASMIAAKFHNTLVRMIVAVTAELGEERVVLTGGCFQNRLLLESSIRNLRAAGFQPYWHHLVPTNDGGIAVGQMAVVSMFGSKGES